MGLKETSLQGSFGVGLGLVFGLKERKSRAPDGVGLEKVCKRE